MYRLCFEQTKKFPLKSQLPLLVKNLEINNKLIDLTIFVTLAFVSSIYNIHQTVKLEYKYEISHIISSSSKPPKTSRYSFSSVLSQKWQLQWTRHRLSTSTSSHSWILLLRYSAPPPISASGALSAAGSMRFSTIETPKSQLLRTHQMPNRLCQFKQ